MHYTAEKITPQLKVFFYVLLAVALWQLGRMLLPFSGSILGAVTLGITFYPLYRLLGRWMPKRSATLKALIADFLVMFTLMVPFVLMTWMVAREAEDIAPVVKEWQTKLETWREGKAVESTPAIRNIRGWLYKTIGVRPSQFRHQFMTTAEGVLKKVSTVGTSIAAGTTVFLLNAALMVITLFFVFRDGPGFYQGLQSYIPMSARNKEALTEKIALTINGIVKGWFVTAVVQGLTAMVGYFIAGVPAAGLFGMLTIFSSLIPTVGSALVWLPLSIGLLVQGAHVKGVFLLVYGTCVVSLIDNILRPYLMGREVDLPFLYLFFALLGGLEVWGTKGIIIGPVLVATIPILLEVYRHYTTQPVHQTEK